MTKPPRRPGLPFSLIDVFADEPLTGNPLAVVADAEGLDEATMGPIAREFNQSETTFLFPPMRKEAFVRLRSFTPTGAEVFGAGHNALGAWWWLADGGKLGDVAKGMMLLQEIGGRMVRTRCEDRVIDLDLLIKLSERLDEDVCTALALHHFDDLTQEEVATAMGMSRRTVGKYLKIAQTTLVRLSEGA